MLRLVHPALEGQGTRPSKGRRRPDCLSLTPDETRHLRAALVNLRRAYGSWSCLAEVMGVSVATLTGARYNPVSPGLALRAARAAGMHLETLLSGALSAAGRCTACGSRVGDRSAHAAGGAS